MKIDQIFKKYNTVSKDLRLNSNLISPTMQIITEMATSSNSKPREQTFQIMWKQKTDLNKTNERMSF